jgi:VanZ family protein
MLQHHKTSAWPLALIYGALVVFATLFPFTGWRAQGIDPWVFLMAPLPPPYWTGFDVTANLLGYAPLGFLLALALLRTGWSGKTAWVIATLTGALLSLVLEFLQIYLPRRVPSNLDLLLNASGALLGALTAWALERWGAINRWSDFRARWFMADDRGALVLLAMWPLALLFPASIPFGLGQVLQRLELAVAEVLTGTPFIEWLPVRDMPSDPLSPSGELLCVALGLLVPCLLGYGVIRHRGRRAAFALMVLVLGVVVTALSAALSWGPVHAWNWLGAPARVGVGAALALAALLLVVPPRACAALALLLLAWQLALLNQAPASAYFAQTLQTWEQGRFIRFYGLGQWLGWLWPYAVLGYLLLRASRRPPPDWSHSV